MTTTKQPSPKKHYSHSLDRTFWSQSGRLAAASALHAMMFSLLGLADVLMVSHLGDSAMAAVGIGGRLFFFNLLVVLGLTGALSVLSAQYYGAGNHAGVRRSLVQTLVCAVVVVLPFVILYTSLPQAVIRLANEQPLFVADASVYLHITAYSLLATPIVLPLEAALRSTGDAISPTIIGLMAIATNIVLNCLLIYGYGGFPELGIAGAAWATSCSRLLQTLVLIVFVMRRRPELIADMKDIGEAITRRQRRHFAAIALPLLLKNTGWGAGVLCYSFIIAQLGVLSLAIISVLGPIETLLMSLFSGIGIAAATTLGHELGGGRFRRAWHQAWALLLVALAIALSLALAIYLGRHALSQHFTTLAPAALELLPQVIAVLSLGLGLKAFNLIAINGVLQSGGDLHYSSFIDLSGIWLIGIPLALLGVYYWQLTLPLLLTVILLEELYKAALSLRRIRQRQWLHKVV